jgi:hypothetical protein
MGIAQFARVKIQDEGEPTRLAKKGLRPALHAGHLALITT